MADGHYILYGSRGSGSASVEVALQACGAAFSKVQVFTREHDSAQDELQSLNPLGQISNFAAFVFKEHWPP